jgi:hypothetical protein
MSSADSKLGRILVAGLLFESWRSVTAALVVGLLGGSLFGQDRKSLSIDELSPKAVATLATEFPDAKVVRVSTIEHDDKQRILVEIEYKGDRWEVYLLEDGEFVAGARVRPPGDLPIVAAAHAIGDLIIALVPCALGVFLTVRLLRSLQVKPTQVVEAFLSWLVAAVVLLFAVHILRMVSGDRPTVSSQVVHAKIAICSLALTSLWQWARSCSARGLSPRARIILCCGFASVAVLGFSLLVIMNWQQITSERHQLLVAGFQGDDPIPELRRPVRNTS